ncbi:MAG: EFR1 family ferrodoxin [Euryarchaeota archaeon]|jgi:ferredoxin/flavodoxin|nr:EFR1 family ferrodoxin [Euryarchaeota archaeon]OPZ92983.1 MAG: NADH-plastoquinone oxidoreductase subunit [Firmicutes bacterium ADurb.Bin419]
MQIEKVEFYYFSGTGNTIILVEKMVETFKKYGVQVQLRPIEKSDPETINLQHTLGLAFPVAGLSTYPLVWEFIESLPITDGTPVFMLDTLAGYSGGIVGPLHNKLKKKGYEPIGACEIIMPLNIFFIQSDETRSKLIEEGLKKADKYAKAIINDEANWGSFPVLPTFLYNMSRFLMRSWEWKSQQKLLGFQVKKSKCNQCGICSQICPLNNIEMKEYPIYKCKCQFCMRCVSLCPQKAINCKVTYKGKTHQAVTAKKFITPDKSSIKDEIKAKP